MKKRILFIIPLLIVLIGVSYAFYNYSRIGEDNNEILSGQIYMRYNDTNTLYLTNVFPETKEEALAEGRTDNEIRFTINGKNTNETRSIYYEIDLNLGDEVSGKNRIRPEDVMIHLECDGEVLVDAISYSEWNEQRLWVETIPANTLTESSKSYVLKAWVSEDVFISDSNPSADYTAQDWNNSYISLRLSVYGDFVEKSLASYMTRGESSFWPTQISDQTSNITEVNFVSLSKEEMNSRYNNASIKADLSETQNESVLAWFEVDNSASATQTSNEDNLSNIARPLSVEPLDTTTKYILYVASVGTTYLPSNCSSMFAGFLSVDDFNFENVSVERTTDISLMFSGCTSMIELNLSGWNTSNITNMYAIFGGCSKLKNLNLRGWDLSSMTNVSGLFSTGLSALETVDLSNWKTSTITSASGMFSGCSSLKNVDFTNWDTSNITAMQSMFGGCSSLTELDLSNWNTQSITDNGLGGMFVGCSGLQKLNLSNWDLTSMTSFTNLFSYGFTSLETLDLSNWKTSNVKTMKDIFKNCSSIKNLNLSGWDLSSMTSMSGFFNEFSTLENVDLSNWKINTITDLSGMFFGCSNLASVNLANWDTSNVANMTSMFANCSSLTSMDLSSWDTSSVTTASSMFNGCTKLSSININNWDLTSLSNMHNLATMFSGCPLITSLSIDGWKLDGQFGFVSFLSGSSVTTLELTNFDLSQSTSTAQMFQGCSTLTSLIIKGWDTSTITDMNNMFCACRMLTTLDLSEFNTSNVTNMSSMFVECPKLETLNISGFNFGSVTNSASMFYYMLGTAKITVGGTTQQNWVLALASPDNRPAAWTTKNVVVKN